MTETISNETRNSAAILCEGLSYFYPDGTQALDQINFKVAAGEKVGIIGPNGAGKSTLLGLLNGILRGRGALSIFGIPVNPKNSAHVKKMVGLVFQNPNDQLFCPTIIEDVVFGPLNLRYNRDEALSAARRALREVGLEGYEKRSSLHLSFGERKIAAIATILPMHPEIIAMDEPTSNLDAQHRRRIINWIKKSGQTFVLTSHDLDMLMETCTRILILNKGKIVADGRQKDILSDQTLLEKNNLELPLSLQLKDTNKSF